MIRTILATALMICMGLGAAQAQQAASGQPPVWVQIEAQPDLAAINAALRRRAADLQDVNGFDLKGSEWYVVALGPYSPATAAEVLRVLRRNGRIPQDSYIAESADYSRQIWPVGADLLGANAATATPEANAPDTQSPDVAALADALAGNAETQPEATELADETPREARAAESLLTREERMDLQVALKWAGQYDGRIDAAFGAGTRNAMAGWQRANGFEPTGILTTRQRAELLRNYNAILDGMGMKMVGDPRVGIEMKLPLGVVKFAKYEPPFAHYDPAGDIPARVLMISQKGDQDTLYGLYDIMQTLEIVPQDGARERRGDSFTLNGANASIVSHTEARLEGGEIKGFTLVWPANDEERRTRVLGLMQDSFTRIDGVLDAAAGQNDAQSIDLVSGLKIRKPEFTRSGFYVDGKGTVVTTSEFVGACGHITIENGQDVDIAASDPALGVAVLRPRATLAPIGVAAFAPGAARLQSDVTVAGYSYGGLLGAPSLTRGTLVDIRGLDGQENVDRLTLAALDGDAGGPVMDAGGAVLGMLLARKEGERTLPDDVAFAVNGTALGEVLSQAGTSTETALADAPLPPAQMAARASGMTVLVSCWK